MAKRTVALVDDLLKQVTRGDISFSRMVELLNETAEGQDKAIIEDAEKFKNDLAIELVARFHGNSRGLPIAKKNFILGAEWYYDRIASLQSQPEISDEDIEK
jgi:hypothetical protein